MVCMNTPQLETERLILRKFTEHDGLRKEFWHWGIVTEAEDIRLT